jgi:hypothetical protein
MDKFVGLFISKIDTGLDKLKKNPSQLENSVRIGYQLHQHLLSSSQDSGELEEILKVYGTDQKTIIWQADLYQRYLTYRRRAANPQHSETGDVYAEDAFKKREVLCKLLSTVVNELEPAWGVCASLVYNAFEGMNVIQSPWQSINRYRDKIQGIYVVPCCRERFRSRR